MNSTYDILFQSFVAPYQPPNDVRLINVQPGQLIFNWTSVDPRCDSVSYNIISSNCGDCPPTTSNANVTCTDIQVASGQVCVLIVQPVVCGNIVGNQSSPTTVIIRGTPPFIKFSYIVLQWNLQTRDTLGTIRPLQVNH